MKRQVTHCINSGHCIHKLPLEMCITLIGCIHSKARAFRPPVCTTQNRLTTPRTWQFSVPRLWAKIPQEGMCFSGLWTHFAVQTPQSGHRLPSEGTHCLCHYGCRHSGSQGPKYSVVLKTTPRLGRWFVNQTHLKTFIPKVSPLSLTGSASGHPESTIHPKYISMVLLGIIMVDWLCQLEKLRSLTELAQQFYTL